MHIHSYPKVYCVGHQYVLDIFSAPVVVEEKVDGSQFSFHVGTDGVLSARSRGKDLDLEHPEGMFSKALSTVQSIKSKLIQGWTYHGEVLDRPKHNTICYNRTPVGNLVIFDIDRGNQTMMLPDEKEHECSRIGLECVPLVMVGMVWSPEQLQAMLDRESFLGGAKIEGVVIKSYAKMTPDGKFMAAKLVSEAFKETHKADWAQRNPGPTDIRDILAQQYAVEARWLKSVQHLRDSGRLIGSDKDIGALIADSRDDLLAECKPEIMDALWNWAKDYISRKSVNGLAQWYKNFLMKGAFNGSSDPQKR